ncbi:hypothetical protein DFH09DRAFT_1271174 [Mycena vulgaris]|nr:hypothetical protein DFH09DRAFT_1271174 [Mycena vulgaris]
MECGNRLNAQNRRLSGSDDQPALWEQAIFAWGVLGLNQSGDRCEWPTIHLHPLDMPANNKTAIVVSKTSWVDQRHRPTVRTPQGLDANIVEVNGSEIMRLLRMCVQDELSCDGTPIPQELEDADAALYNPAASNAGLNSSGGRDSQLQCASIQESRAGAMNHGRFKPYVSGFCHRREHLEPAQARTYSRAEESQLGYSIGPASRQACFN